MENPSSFKDVLLSHSNAKYSWGIHSQHAKKWASTTRLRSLAHVFSNEWKDDETCFNIPEMISPSFAHQISNLTGESTIASTQKMVMGQHQVFLCSPQNPANRCPVPKKVPCSKKTQQKDAMAIPTSGEIPEILAYQIPIMDWWPSPIWACIVFQKKRTLDYVCFFFRVLYHHFPSLTMVSCLARGLKVTICFIWFTTWWLNRAMVKMAHWWLIMTHLWKKDRDFPLPCKFTRGYFV